MNEPRHKGFYIIPNLFTTASLFAGFLGILWAVNGQYQLSALSILFSFVCDGLDGKVARITKAHSDFGVQMDSLADLVSFGVNPSLMVYLWLTNTYGRLGMVSAFLFIACGALRLARFNVQAMRGGQSSKKFFIGLPIPAAACILAATFLFSTYFSAEGVRTIFAPFCLILVYGLSLLMVSRVRYASFKDIDVVKAHPFTASVGVVMLFVLVASEPKLLGFVFFMTYLISGLFFTFIVFPLRKGTFLKGLSRQEPLR